MNPLPGQIQREIEASGAIRFARFMELALYAPDLGYYERQTEIGRAGDFFTSVSVGDLFGHLLAFQFAEWLEEYPGDHRVQIVEAGAHKGQLAADILHWLHTWRPELHQRVEYWLVEPSSRHRTWQQATLRRFSKKMRWAENLGQVAEACEQVRGVVFSNELLDAMPVHLLRWNASEQNWQELRVGWDGERFTWEVASVGEDLCDHLPQLPEDLEKVLPDGFMFEVSPAACQWWRAAAAILSAGMLVTVDYGLSREEFFAPERSKGTLRAYSKHRVSDDILSNVGAQDITAHVNFTSLQDVGHAEGLDTKAFIPQSKFLTQIFSSTLRTPTRFDPWTPPRIRQFQTLTHPEHLGRAFRVLVQSRTT